MGSLLENVANWEAIFHIQSHKQTRHQRKMKVHVTFIPSSVIFNRIFRPLVRLSKQHPVREFLIYVLPQMLQEYVSFWQVFAVSTFALVQVRHRIHAQSVYSQCQRSEER